MLKRTIATLWIGSAVAWVSLGITDAKANPNPWTDCGIGAILFSDTPWAALSCNVTTDLGTTGTTSSLSSPNSCEGAEAVAAVFISESYASLEEETATGEGAHIGALLTILGCSTPEHGTIAESIRSDFTRMVSDPGYESLTALEKAQGYHRIVIDKASGEFGGVCRVI